jgi:PAS domain S-box-containing protein
LSFSIKDPSNIQEQVEELNKDLHFLKSIQDNAAHAIISTKIDGTITSFNRKAEELLGYKAEDLIGKESPAVFHDLDEVVQRTEQFSKKLDLKIEPGFATFICHTEKGLKNEFEWTYVHKKGSRFPVWLSITDIKDNNGEVIGYLGIAQDLTEQKLLEKKLTKKNKELELAQSIAKIGSWRFDVRKGQIQWSEGMYQIFPEKIEDGEPDFEKHKSTIHPEDVKHWESVVGQCLQDGMPYRMQFRTHKIDKKDEVVWVEARGRGKLVKDKVVSLSGTCQDITETVLKNEELRLHADALEKAEQAKSEFLANMSHEIRTPMNGVIGMLELLSETKLSETQKEMLDAIMISSESLLNILSDILDISKINAGKLDLETVSFDLSQMLEDVCYLMSAKAQENNTTLEKNISSSEEYWFKGDVTRIRQVIINFVSNAIKFTENGKVEIGLEVEESIGPNAKLRIYVKDNGIGISPDKQKNLFAAFEQADSSITRKFGGTGLGLSICSKLARAMGGKVLLESKVGEGSIFYFEIELEKTEKSIGKIKTKNSDAGFATRYPHNIILAEDNKVNQKVASMVLEKIGYRCDLAENGLEVLKLIKDKPLGHYTVVLMDLQMPTMDGLTATKKIIKNCGDKSPDIIALTANAFAADKEKCLAAGMIDYLSKPLRKEQLKEKLALYSKGQVLERV